MANTGNRIGDFTEEIEQAVGEVAGEVKDSVGEMIEQGVQSVAGTQLTPQQIQQQQVEEQKQLIKARKEIKWHQDIKAAQQRVRDEQKQKQLQQKQLEEEKQQRRRLAQDQNNRTIVSPAKRTPDVSGQTQQVPTVEEELKRSKQETGKGHGIGG